MWGSIYQPTLLEKLLLCYSGSCITVRSLSLSLRMRVAAKAATDTLPVVKRQLIALNAKWRGGMTERALRTGEINITRNVSTISTHHLKL